MRGMQLIFALVAKLNIHLAVKLVKWKYKVR